MRYFILCCATLLISFSSFAKNPSIVAIVNDAPITIQEFQSRVKFLQLVNNVPELTETAATQLKKTALKTLIDEQLFIQEGKKLNIVVSEADINRSIQKIETDNNMAPGQFTQNLVDHNIGVSTLKQQIKAQLIKEHLAYGYFARNIDINRNEVDQAASLANKDFMLKLKKFTTKSNDKAVYAKLSSLKAKIPNCAAIDPKHFASFARVEDVTIAQSKLPEPIKNDLQKLKINQTTDILHEANHLTMYILCAKNIMGVSDSEYDFVANNLANKKLSIQIQKYYERLKKKSYIKTFINE